MNNKAKLEHRINFLKTQELWAPLSKEETKELKEAEEKLKKLTLKGLKSD